MHQPQVDEDQFGERNEGKKDIWNCVNKCMDYFPSAKNLICTNNLSIFQKSFSWKNPIFLKCTILFFKSWSKNNTKVSPLNSISSSTPLRIKSIITIRIRFLLFDGILRCTSYNVTFVIHGSFWFSFLDGRKFGRGHYFLWVRGLRFDSYKTMKKWSKVIGMIGIIEMIKRSNRSTWSKWTKWQKRSKLSKLSKWKRKWLKWSKMINLTK